MVSEEKVRHIAALAKLNVSDDEMIKYQKQLTDILTEIDTLLKVDIKNEEIMISPSDNRNVYSEDVIENHISKSDAFKNAKRVKGDYIVVPKVIE